MMIAQSYTATELIAIIGSVGGLVTLIIGGIVTIMNARMKSAVKEVKEGIAVVLAPVTETLAKAKVIEGHVNSEKSVAEGEIKTLTAENRLYREQLAEARQNAALLAAKVPVPLQVINGPQPPTGLTDAPVQELKKGQP